MKRNILYFNALGVLLIALFAADLLFGSVNLPVKELFTTEIGNDLLYKFRLPKAIVALLSGIALSVCGLQMQTLFRNPLADPYILGVSSGSGVGVALYLMGVSLFGGFAEGTLFSTLGTAGAAILGASAVTMIILYISNRVKNNLSLLIFGVMIGFVAGAVVTLLQYTSTATSLKAYVLWTMGSFAGLDSMQIALLALMVVAGTILAVGNIKDLNAILPGEEYARSIGLNVRHIRNKILISTTLLVGAVTAFCGPIGFLGIAVPHICRFIFRDANHRILIPATALLGGALMLLADTASQLPGTGSIVPINTMTALLGIPVILVIILRRK